MGCRGRTGSAPSDGSSKSAAGMLCKVLHKRQEVDHHAAAKKLPPELLVSQHGTCYTTYSCHRASPYTAYTAFMMVPLS